MIDLFQEIYASIKKNKLRTFLTGFAVAWGIFILIVLLGAGNGLLNGMTENMKIFNNNSISISAGWTSQPSHGYQRGRNIVFRDVDLNLLEEQLGNYIYNGGASIEYSRTLSTNKDYLAGSMEGVYPSYQVSEALKMKEGRFINLKDNLEKRRVAVIHEEAVEILFDTASAIGQTVMIDSLAYSVVGVYEGFGYRRNSDFYVPFQSIKLIYNKDNVDNLSFLLSPNIKTEAENDSIDIKIRKVLAAKHNFNADDRRAVWIWNRLSNYLQQQSANSALTIAIWVIGILTLLSGVVGVSNIMLITVKERTREFGIRKALGAKPSSILRLVLIESIVITTLFGYIGMLAGIGATELLNAYAGQQVMDAGAFSATVFSDPTVRIGVAIQATLTLIIAGTIAGYIPARRATRIKPVDALNAK